MLFRSLKSILNHLTEKRIILIEGSKIKITLPFDFNNIPKTTSIEVKINDWINGFYQAKRYLLFSDYSYLAIYESFIKNVDLKILSSEGIGLISIGNDTASVLLEAKKSKICHSIYKYIAFSSLTKELKADTAYLSNYHNYNSYNGPQKLDSYVNLNC
mgnify:CR=1 FL=1